MRPILILRPQPGADESAGRAAVLGLEAVCAPIFTIQPCAWQAPSSDGLDALLLTSANAARHAGTQLAAFTHLPCYAVGPSSAKAARDVGFTDVRTGPGDGTELLAAAVHDQITSALHLCGRDHVALEAPGLTVLRKIVYAALPCPKIPEAGIAALARDAYVLFHSRAAAAHFAKLVDALASERDAIDVLAISLSAAAAAGPGWKSVHVADRPRDEALLELALNLCKTKGHEHGV